MDDLTELRKQIYNFGWILSKDNLNPPNMCLRTIFNENSTDMLQINIPVSSKEQIIESLKKQLEISRNHKIEGKIKWNSLASISLNISFNAFYGTLEIYQDTCAISYNPNRKDKIKTDLEAMNKRAKINFIVCLILAILFGILIFTLSSDLFFAIFILYLFM